MCVIPNTTEYAECLTTLAARTRTIASGEANAYIWLQRGFQLQQLHDLAGAVRDFTRALDRADELTAEHQAWVYDHRNTCLRQLDRFDEAVADGEAAVARLPEEPDYRLNLGYARLRGGDAAGGLADLNHALALQPDLDLARIYRGRAYMELGQHAAAIADHTYILDKSDRDLAYHLQLARAQSYLALQRYGDVLADCAEAEQHVGADKFGARYQVHLLRGYAYLGLGQAEAALGEFTRTIAYKPDLLEIYLWRGVTYRRLGDSLSAADDLATFVARFPGGARQAMQLIANAMETTSGAPTAQPVAATPLELLVAA